MDVHRAFLVRSTLIVRIPVRFQRRGGRKPISAPDGRPIVPANKPRPDGTMVRRSAGLAVAADFRDIGESQWDLTYVHWRESRCGPICQRGLRSAREVRLTDNPDDAWVVICRSRARVDAEQYALVLAAVGINCRLVKLDGGVALSVAPPDAARARQEVASYARENQRQNRSSHPMRALIEGIDSALAYCAVLLFLYGASRRQTFSHDWWSAGVAQAGPIADGEWWRTLTALGLHADLGHLVGNLAFGSVLGLLLAQLLGPGLAWLAILLGGAGGNALNALLHPATHTAVGASTAIFAALGILAGLRWRRRAALWPHGLRRWLPLAAGMMLLAYLGFGGERTDIGGHVAGFAVGAALGVGLAYAGNRVPQGVSAQWAFGIAALVLLALAWLLALRAHG
jgi:rhomboid protease GluP